MKMRKEKDFLSFFDERTGRYIRTGIIKNGKDSGEDPFMASFPELLDIGIMGHCTHGKTGLCIQAGVECYQNGLYRNDANMNIDDFADIAHQCSGRTYQFALGGCGDPDQHEYFSDILEICHQEGIIPNFTTSGFGITQKTAELCKKYCGAVAVSWYRNTYTERAIHTLIDAGVKTNIHYVLSNNTITEAIERLKEHSFPPGINAVIFLLHKPIGLGKPQNVIGLNNNKLHEFIHLIDSGEFEYKIGFDSCTVPALINLSKNINMDSLDTCEGARWSAYISSDMKMMPCSFDNQEMRWAVDLRHCTIEDAWKSDIFDAFRSHFKASCPNCTVRSLCMGGCPITPEIILCDKQCRT